MKTDLAFFLALVCGGVVRGDGHGGPPQYGGGLNAYEDGNSAQDAFNALGEAIPGSPGEDYPILAEVPETSFVCDGQVEGGYYADPEGECQVFHICGGGVDGELIQYSFLCPNGSLFNQEYFVCDWWFNVDCSQAEGFYFLNDEIAAEREANSPQSSYGAPGGQAGYAGGNGNGGRKNGSRRPSSSSASSSYSSSSSSYSGPSAAASSISSDYSFPSSSGGYEAPSAGSGYAAGEADSSYSSPSGSDEYQAPGDEYGGPTADYGIPSGVQPGRRGRSRHGRRG